MGTRRHCAGCDLIEAPWTADEVENLRRWQEDGRVHEFTGTDGGALIPTEAGWIAVEGGPVVQTWAYEFMTNGAHIAAMNKT